MTLLKQLLEVTIWKEGDYYTTKTVQLSSNPKVGIQGPFSYKNFIEDFSTQEAKDVHPDFVRGTYFVTHTETDFEHEFTSAEGKKNTKIFKSYPQANAYVKNLKIKLEQKYNK